jgi:membrane dipeptidase
MLQVIDHDLSRRTFLTAAACASGAALMPTGWLHAASAAAATGGDPHLVQIRRTTVAIDMHNHVFSGVGGLGLPMATPPGAEPLPPLLLAEEMRKAGFTAVVAGYKIPFDANAKPGETNVKFLSWLTTMDAALADQRMSRALNLADLQAAHRQGRPTVIQSIEGAQFLEGHLERIEVGYKRGLRHLQLLHDNDDPVVPQGDLDTRPAHLGGLTPFGADIIRECNRLGILVDLAHASPETILAATKVATKPFIMSHVGFDYPVDENQRMYNVVKPRRLTRERAQVIANQGGVIGVWVYLARSPKEYVEHVRHMVDAAGIDHVGIGSDTDLLSPRAGNTNSAWPGMTGGFFDAVAAEMLLQGFTPADIAKFGGGNYCRVFDKATAGHA